MNKAVLVSISPEWCEKIASGKKTVEVRKTHPKIDTPFKCYIYCDEGMELWGEGTGTTWRGIDPNEDIDEVYKLNPMLNKLNGEVIGEFVCDKIYNITTPKDYFSEYLFFAHHGKSPEGSQDLDAKKLLKETCLSMDDMIDYANGKELFGWRIDDLKIYDKPKELGEFYSAKVCKDYFGGYSGCEDVCGYAENGKCFCGHKRVNRPPQDWCYVEELGGGK